MFTATTDRCGVWISVQVGANMFETNIVAATTDQEPDHIPLPRDPPLQSVDGHYLVSQAKLRHVPKPVHGGESMPIHGSLVN